MLDWEIDMHDIARDLSGQLDSKMSMLKHLIREADLAAARLESALQRAQEPRDPIPAPDSPSDPAFAGAASTLGQPSEVASTAWTKSGAQTALPKSQPGDQAAALKSVGASGPTSSTRGTGEAESRAGGDRRYDEIYLLADYGFDAPAIASRVGSPVGEVELILGLRQKR
jgi:hypothetical protein